MSSRRGIRTLTLAFLLAAAGGCATSPPGSGPGEPTLTLEQHSLRIPLAVGRDGSVSLAEHPPLVGRLDLSPILKAERLGAAEAKKSAIQLMVHYGRFYVVGESFRAIWEITPRPGTTKASYRPIPVVQGETGPGLRGARLSLYGSSRSSCLRLDRSNGDTVFVTPDGKVGGVCP